MTTNELYILLISTIAFIAIILLISIIAYNGMKFRKYMHETYEIFNKILDTHKKFDEKLIFINRNINLGLKHTNTKYKFDNYKVKFNEYELTNYYNHFNKVKDAAKSNSENKSKYQKQLNDIIKQETKDLLFDTTQYSIKRQQKYLDDFISRNKTNLKEYHNQKHYEKNGTIKLTLRYTSPKGQNRYTKRIYVDSFEIEYRYHKEIVIPREEERIKIERLQNRLYHNKIYMYSDINYSNMICIGETTRKNVEDRIKEQYKLMPIKPYVIHHFEFAQYNNSKKWFSDRSFHRYLEKHGYERLLDENGVKTEWFSISIDKAKLMLEEFKNTK